MLNLSCITWDTLENLILQRLENFGKFSQSNHYLEVHMYSWSIKEKQLDKIQKREHLL